MSETVYRVLTLDEARALARGYADTLCKAKPETYETYSETSEGTSRLSDAILVILDALAARERELAEAQDAADV